MEAAGICNSSLCFINYNNGNLVDDKWFSLYINILLFMNGSFFNYLTLGSYFEKKYKKLD